MGRCGQRFNPRDPHDSVNRIGVALIDYFINMLG
jgi:hypothetical protein